MYHVLVCTIGVRENNYDVRFIIRSLVLIYEEYYLLLVSNLLHSIMLDGLLEGLVTLTLFAYDCKHKNTERVTNNNMMFASMDKFRLKRITRSQSQPCLINNTKKNRNNYF